MAMVMSGARPCAFIIRIPLLPLARFITLSYNRVT